MNRQLVTATANYNRQVEAIEKTRAKLAEIRKLSVAQIIATGQLGDVQRLNELLERQEQNLDLIRDNIEAIGRAQAGLQTVPPPEIPAPEIPEPTVPSGVGEQAGEQLGENVARGYSAVIQQMAADTATLLCDVAKRVGEFQPIGFTTAGPGELEAARTRQAEEAARASRRYSCGRRFRARHAAHAVEGLPERRPKGDERPVRPRGRHQRRGRCGRRIDRRHWRLVPTDHWRTG